MPHPDHPGYLPARRGHHHCRDAAQPSDSTEAKRTTQVPAVVLTSSNASSRGKRDEPGTAHNHPEVDDQEHQNTWGQSHQPPPGSASQPAAYMIIVSAPSAERHN
jgi:hypothetical protein